MEHIPVLLEDTLTLLDIQESDIVVDCTLGLGGHSSAILKKINTGQLIGLDQDPIALEKANEHLKTFSQFTSIQSNFENIDTALARVGIKKADKILADLGMSSLQLDATDRGFSFQQDGPLDMRMDPSPKNKSAADILNRYSQNALIEMFKAYGDLGYPDKLVDWILATRKNTPIKTVDMLMTGIKKSFFFKNNRKLFMRTCSQVFQALRIEVNQEFKVLETLLSKLADLTQPGARVAFITFHSSEDRLIKYFFKAHTDQFKPINKKVIQARFEEVKQNPRAHSAKLRVLERI